MKKILILGHNGLVGSALVTAFKSDSSYRTIAGLDRQRTNLRNAIQVDRKFQKLRPDYVVLAAAKVGGIQANQSLPVEFLQWNMEIITSVFSAAQNSGVEKFIFLGSSCIYPRDSEQPIKESALLTSALEKTNEAYALAKICGVKLCEYYAREYQKDFRAVMPTNLYGLNDTYSDSSSHVIPNLIRKFHLAKLHNHETVEVWGTGKPKREFLYSSDLAFAVKSVLEIEREAFSELCPDRLINIGSGHEISIADLSQQIAEIVGFNGHIEFNTDRPDGTPRKLLDSSRVKSIGWVPRTQLREGITNAYKDYLISTTNP